MKIPISWLKDYVQTDKSATEIAESFTALGLMLDKPIGDGKVLDLEHRMDRSDWLSIVGCARDLAALEGERLIFPKLYGKPGKTGNKNDLIPVTVECSEVRRFTTRIFRGIKVGPSPSWLSERLEDYGIKSINNIVDITNYVMVELGNPLHAQDLAKLPTKELTWRYAKEGEKLTTFLGTELTLDSKMFVMTSADQPVVLGGIVGGAQTGVTESTKDFILDAGNYDQKSVRRTSRKLHINNETVLRSDKFLDPRSTEIALARATELILELAGGTYYTNDDYYKIPVTSKLMTLTLNRIHLLSGMDINLIDCKKILTSLGYAIVEQTDTSLTVEVPYFRTDIDVEDDLVADILRISNYKNIPSSPLTTPVPKDITPKIYKFEDKLRDVMVGLGADEHITTSFVEKDEKVNRVVLENALTSEAGALRLSIEETLINVLGNYKKHNLEDKVIFEVGLTFSRSSSDGSYASFKETRELVAISHYDIRPVLAGLMHELGIDYDLEVKNNHVTINTNRQKIGTLILNSFSLNTEALLSYAKEYCGVVSDFTHTTSIDISLTKSVPRSYSEIKSVIKDVSPNVLKLEVIEEHRENILLRLTWDEKTDYLKEKEVILKSLNDKLQITSRSI